MESLKEMDDFIRGNINGRKICVKMYKEMGKYNG